jgi:hypothetical protein
MRARVFFPKRVRHPAVARLGLACTRSMANRSFKLQLPRPRLRTWLEDGMSHLLSRVRSSAWQNDVQRLGAEVQRFGGSAWRTIASRWPALAELVKERKFVSARYRPTAAKKPEDPALSAEAIAALLAQLRSASSWQTRASAAHSLAHVEAEGVLEALVQGLRDPSVEVAVAVVDALSSHHERASTQALLDVLENLDGYFSPVTRVAAMAGLARRLSVGELAPVLKAVRDRDAEVSIAAIAVVAECAPSLATEHVMPILRDGSGYFLPLVRLAAANALERAGCLSETLVRELLQTEPDAAVRRILERTRYVAAQAAVPLT